MKLLLLSIPALLTGSLVGCAMSNDSDDAAVANWQDSIATNPTTEAGCYHASYPDMTWSPADCSAAPNRPFAAKAAGATEFTVGNGNDYAIQVAGLIAKASGSFLKSTAATESDGGKNVYSIQLNSNFMSGTAACNGVSGCLSWAQFVYSSSEQSAFIQNWLIGIGTCPDSSWFDAGGGDCFKNSAAVTVPVIPITDLAQLKMTGGAVKGGNDSLVFAFGTEAFRTSEKDNITDLASAWNASEFNIIGDGGASAATFGKGSSITVKVGVNDHTTNVPQCIANDGTTGETNNLTLGTCKAFVASGPSIEFTEKN